MKRSGRVRECDSRYLSGRPSFTISSWGETNQLTHEALTEIGQGGRAVGQHTKAGNGDFSYSNVVKGQGSAAGQFKAATSIYTASALPLLSHVWPTISQEQLAQFAAVAERGMGRSVAMSVQSKNRRARQSVDAYAAGGSKFRMSTAGIGISTHAAINTDNLTAADKRQWAASQARKRVNESKRDKPRWNRSPHVFVPALPKLKDELDMTPEEATSTRKSSGKKHVKSTYGSPMRLVRPETVTTGRIKAKAVYVQDARKLGGGGGGGAKKGTRSSGGAGRRTSMLPKASLGGFDEEDEGDEEDSAGLGALGEDEEAFV